MRLLCLIFTLISSSYVMAYGAGITKNSEAYSETYHQIVHVTDASTDGTALIFGKAQFDFTFTDQVSISDLSPRVQCLSVNEISINSEYRNQLYQNIIMTKEDIFNIFLYDGNTRICIGSKVNSATSSGVVFTVIDMFANGVVYIFGTDQYGSSIKDQVELSQLTPRVPSLNKIQPGLDFFHSETNHQIVRVTDVFSNGVVYVSRVPSNDQAPLNYSFKNQVNLSDLFPKISCLNEIYSGSDVYLGKEPYNEIVHVTDIFAKFITNRVYDGVAYISVQKGDSLVTDQVNISELSPRILCLNEICINSEVYIKNSKQLVKVTNMFANGIVYIAGQNDGFSFTNQVRVSDLDPKPGFLGFLYNIGQAFHQQIYGHATKSEESVADQKKDSQTTPEDISTVSDSSETDRMDSTPLALEMLTQSPTLNTDFKNTTVEAEL